MTFVTLGFMIQKSSVAAILFPAVFKKDTRYRTIKLREIIPIMSHSVIWVMSIVNVRCFTERDTAHANI